MATMQVRIAILATLLAAAYGCATEPEQQAGAAAPAQPQPSRGYITGSRLPLPDDGGSSTVGGVSGGDYAHDRNSQISPIRSQ